MLNAPKICLAGKNRIAVDALLYLIERGWKDRVVVCPNRSDSGVSTWQPSLIRFAREFGVEVVTLDQAQKISDLVFISLEFDTIVRPTEFKTNRLYNIHFSALPAYKGMYTSALPMLYGESCSGVTLHEIDAGIDTGPIIAQTIFHIPDTWTARDLYFAYMDRGFVLFRENVARLVAADPPEATSQSAKGSSYFAKSKIDYTQIAINLRDTADGIIRQVRAFSFREYQTPVIEGMEIGGWEILSEPSREKPGSVLDRDADCITLATIDYRLRLTRSCVWDWFAVFDESRSDGLNPAFIDIPDKNGWTPLIRAAFAGDGTLCRRLLDAGADPNFANTNGTTPLMYASSGKNPDEVTSLLLAFGASPEQRDLFGNNLERYHPHFARCSWR